MVFTVKNLLEFLSSRSEPSNGLGLRTRTGKTCREEEMFMTRNQIEFSKLQELRRSNAANERIAEEHNTRTRAETERSNRAREAETERSNRASERIRDYTNVINAQHFSASDAEARRHNVAQEGLGFVNAMETQAHNRETESIQQQQNAINQQNADTASGRAANQNAADAASANRSNAQAGAASAQQVYFQQQTAYTRNRDLRETAQMGLNALDTGARVLNSVTQSAVRFVPLFGD